MADGKRLVRALGEGLRDIFYPVGVECVACRAAACGDLLCPECQTALRVRRLSEPLCPLCGEPLSGAVCPRCQGGWHLRGVSVWQHRDAPRRLVERLKFGGELPAAYALLPGLTEAAEGLSLSAETVVTWVPMRAEKLRRRGLDHAGVLARGLAERLGLACRGLLMNESPRTLVARGQIRRSRQGRLSRVLKFSPEGDTPRRVLLVDDVLTTGATITAAAGALEDRGAEVAFITATR